jgi:hypothetical protein
VETVRALTLEEAVRQLARAKPYWVRAELRGGTGAGQAGAPGPGGLHALGYEELMTLAQRDPAEFRKYLLGNREEWTAKKRAFFAGRK